MPNSLQKFLNNYLFDDWITNTIKDAIIVVDKYTKILYVNAQWEKLMGYRLNEIQGQKLLDIEPDSVLNKVVQTGNPVIGKLSYLRKKGLNIITNSLPIFDNKKISGGIGIFRETSQLEQLIDEMLKMKGLIKYYEEQLTLKDSLPPTFSSLLGENKEFIKALVKAFKASQSNATTLIEGESGVGKNLLARAIHMSGNRNGKPFIDVNCAAIPEALLESELFGYVGGSFTGARKEGKMGKVELANEGTLFLDEIGDMSLIMQAKILKLLQERVIERVGGHRRLSLDIRIIAATNKDLRSMVKDGTFREDLYFRLCAIPIYIPPLRQRKDDILLLVEHFINKYNNTYNKKVALSKNVLKLLINHDWPGNVRELDNVIGHSVLMCPAGIISEEHLPATFEQTTIALLESLGTSSNEFPKLKYLVEEVEKKAIISALKKTNYNKSKAMEILGLTRRVFYLKIKKYGLKTE